MARVLEGSLRRRRAEGRSADQHEVRRGREARSAGSAPTRATKRRTLFPKAAKVATKPFIYLSAGVSNAEFTESLALAGEAGVAILRRALRACDLEGRHFRLRESRAARAFRQWLETKGVENIKNVNAALKPACPGIRSTARRARTRWLGEVNLSRSSPCPGSRSR